MLTEHAAGCEVCTFCCMLDELKYFEVCSKAPIQLNLATAVKLLFLFYLTYQSSICTDSLHFSLGLRLIRWLLYSVSDSRSKKLGSMNKELAAAYAVHDVEHSPSFASPSVHRSASSGELGGADGCHMVPKSGSDYGDVTAAFCHCGPARRRPDRQHRHTLCRRDANLSCAVGSRCRRRYRPGAILSMLSVRGCPTCLARGNITEWDVLFCGFWDRRKMDILDGDSGMAFARFPAPHRPLPGPVLIPCNVDRQKV